MHCIRCGCDIDQRLKLSKEMRLCKKCYKMMKKVKSPIVKSSKKKIQRGG
jgi:hypothetical protein